MDGIALYPRLRQLDEMSIPKMEAGQTSVGRLFKDFDGKVGGVADAGGIKLRDESKGVWKFKVASGTQGKRDVYDLIIYWSDLPKQIAKFGRDKRVWKDDGTGIDLSKLAQAIFDEADIKVQHNCPAWCVTGDTIVPTIDGQRLSIQQLFDKYGYEKEFVVYSVNEQGDMVPGVAKHLGVTGVVNNLIKIVLDNGKEIKCTPEHLIMLRDGSYKEAKDLVVGQSLMPLYFKEYGQNKKFIRKYLWVKKNSAVRKSNGTGIYVAVHTVVAREFLKKEYEEKYRALVETGVEKGLVVHHKDFNADNNMPENLQWFGIYEHIKWHAKHAKDNPRAKEMIKYWSDKGAEFNRSKEGRTLASNRMTRRMKTKKLLRAIKKGLRKEECRKSSGLRMQERWTEERRKEQSLTMMNRLKLTGDKNSMVKEDNRLMIQVARIMKVCLIILSHRLPVTEETFSEFRSVRCKTYKNYFKDVDSLRVFVDLAFTKSIDFKYRGFWPEDKKRVLEHTKQVRGLVGKQEALYNHKIVRLESVMLDAPVFVYDINVEHWHNFLVGAGVMVHNCYWGFKYMATKNKMAYADFERRPPDIRNPQRLGVGCKHFQLWLERIPFYTGTLAGHIGRYYRREVQQAERGISKQKVENG